MCGSLALERPQPYHFPMTKPEARRRMKEILAAIPAGEAVARSRLAVERLLATRWWSESEVVLTYLSMAGEPDTSALVRAALEQGRTVAAPVIEGLDISFRVVCGPVEGLRRDRRGIPQPDPAGPRWTARAPSRLLVVVPGLAFDSALNRLGRGGGFYDRFLRSVRERPGLAVTAVAIAFDEQLVEEVPHDDDDAPLDGVVTDRRLIGVPAARGP